MGTGEERNAMNDDLADDESASKRLSGKRRKLLFSPIPLRAATDNRLSARHFRVLMAVASHDRLGRNGQGCWVGRKKLSEEAGLSETHTSDALSELRIFGYIRSEANPMNRRTLIHRVTYESADRSHSWDASDNATGPTNGTYRDEIGPEFDPNRSRIREEQVPSENVRSMNGNGNQPYNILKDIEDNKRGSFSDGRYSAEAGTSEIERRTLEAETYLSDVEAFASDPLTLSAVKLECSKLSQIADNGSLPESLRIRAASLRDVARGVT